MTKGNINRILVEYTGRVDELTAALEMNRNMGREEFKVELQHFREQSVQLYTDIKEKVKDDADAKELAEKTQDFCAKFGSSIEAVVQASTNVPQLGKASEYCIQYFLKKIKAEN